MSEKKQRVQKVLKDYWIAPIEAEKPIDENNVLLVPNRGVPVVIPAFSEKQAVAFFVRRVWGIERGKALREKIKTLKAVPVTTTKETT